MESAATARRARGRRVRPFGHRHVLSHGVDRQRSMRRQLAQGPTCDRRSIASVPPPPRFGIGDARDHPSTERWVFAHVWWSRTQLRAWTTALSDRSGAFLWARRRGLDQTRPRPPGGRYVGLGMLGDAPHDHDARPAGPCGSPYSASKRPDTEPAGGASDQPVTVVIASRDGTADLATSLPSVLASTYPSLRVLVVDSAPHDDGTEALVRRIADVDDRLLYLCEPLPGLSRRETEVWIGRRHRSWCSSAPTSSRRPSTWSDWLPRSPAGPTCGASQVPQTHRLERRISPRGSTTGGWRTVHLHGSPIRRRH